MTTAAQSSIVLVISLVLMLFGLIFAVFVDPYMDKRRRGVMIGIVGLVFVLLWQNWQDYAIYMEGGSPYSRMLLGILGYCVRPAILALFFYIVSDKKTHNAVWVLIAVNTLVHLSALFSGVCFKISPDNHFVRGPLGYTCHIISALLLAQLLFVTVLECRDERKKDLIIPAFNTAMILSSVAADTNADPVPVSFLTAAVVLSCLFYYIWLHLQFVRQHENVMKEEQRIRIMVSQIQPHFLFNTLSTIQSLCLIDPKKASETVEKFGTYLRQNLDSLNREDVILFETELEHTKVYAEIEMLRFPNIKVEYDIEDTTFGVPALSLQPLVENAIRHGVRVRRNGLVTVSTREYPGYHEIRVTDNGKGFNVAEAMEADKSHIGLRNVKNRIETLCSGTFLIDSKLGEGTEITIRIPIRAEQNGKDAGK
jgi:two-component sensor histidine kinase